MSISKAYRYTTETGGSGPDTVLPVLQNACRLQAEALEQKSRARFVYHPVSISGMCVGSFRDEWAHFARYKNNRIETTQRSSGRLLQGSTNSTLDVQEPGRFVIPSPALSQLSVIIIAYSGF